MLNCGLSLTEMVSNYEKKLIEEALNNSRNVTEAADKLHITKQALSYKLAKYELNFKKASRKGSAQ